LDREELTARKKFERKQKLKLKEKNLEDYEKERVEFSGVTDPVKNIEVIKGVKVTFGGCVL
jgi:hypothetical protein